MQYIFRNSIILLLFSINLLAIDTSVYNKILEINILKQINRTINNENSIKDKLDRYLLINSDFNMSATSITNIKNANLSIFNGFNKKTINFRLDNGNNNELLYVIYNSVDVNDFLMNDKIRVTYLNNNLRKSGTSTFDNITNDIQTIYYPDSKVNDMYKIWSNVISIVDNVKVSIGNVTPTPVLGLIWYYPDKNGGYDLYKYTKDTTNISKWRYMGNTSTVINTDDKNDLPYIKPKKGTKTNLIGALI